jgi:hypothetical protein
LGLEKKKKIRAAIGVLLPAPRTRKHGWT